ncbi:hypothetical protein LguiA_001372 [Lonicera macranthoides]
MMEWVVVAGVVVMVVIMVKSDEFKSGFESIEGLGFFFLFFITKDKKLCCKVLEFVEKDSKVHM